MPTRIEMRRYGPPEVLEPAEHADYEPGLGEVVVRVVLAAVNRADCFIRSGEWPQRGGWPYVPGLECCGTVERLGEGVDDFVLGEPVITMMQKLGGIHGTRPGGYQETVLVPANTVARVPAALDLRLVGALGLAAVTAVEATRVLEVRPGMRVLVTGGSSAVGTLAIQFLQDLGAEVVATTTRPEKSDALLALGALQAVDTRDLGWPSRIDPVHRVFDLVGHATFAGSVSRLHDGGRLVFVGGTSGGELTFSGWDLMRGTTLTGYSSETLTRDGLQDALEVIAGAVGRGAVRLPAVKEFPLREAARAHEELEAGRTIGRVVLVPGGPH